MKSLLHGMEGGFIEPGPSGLITRGKPDVLPTGRNFYSLDPATVPSKAAWRVGRKLAHLLIAKYQEEQGRIPENVAMYWMASDIMWADGEQLAQMLFLLGVEPVWKGGRVTGLQSDEPGGAGSAQDRCHGAGQRNHQRLLLQLHRASRLKPSKRWPRWTSRRR